MIAGSPATIPFFTGDEKRKLYECFRVLDERPSSGGDPGDGDDGGPIRPSVRRRELDTVEQAFQPLKTWEEILIPLGWTKYGRPKGNVQEWSRPGREGSKSASVTATTFCCWSSSTPLPTFEQPVTAGGHGNNVLSKLDVYKWLHHGGNKEEALAAVGLALPIEKLPERKPEDERTLKSWREESAVERALVIERPGVYFDGSPPGVGKTFSTITTLKSVATSVIALPTHEGCEELVSEMKKQGLKATAFPQLSEKTCQNFGEASTATSYGLSVGAAVCPGCPFSKNKTCNAPDQYQGLMKAAKAAKHKVCTHERLRLSAATITEGASAVVVDEKPEEVLAPSLIASVEDLAYVRDFLNEVVAGSYGNAELAFATRLQRTYKAIFEQVKIHDQPGVFDMPLASAQEAEGSQWQRMFYQWIKKFGVKNTSPARQKSFQQAIGLLARATTGELRVCQLLVERTTVKETSEINHYLRGSWLLPLDYANTKVFLLDGTASKDDIEAAIGRSISDITPSGHLAFVKPATQVLIDLTKSNEAVKLACLIMDFLDHRPEIQRLGIIGHQKQVKEIMAKRELLPEEYLCRIAKTAYWGQGPERASNRWHKECDHLAICGTPRRNAREIRSWLALHGLNESAQLESGDWGPRRWAGPGSSEIFAGRGYRNPDWHRASVAMVRADMTQGLCRSRAILEDGIPVTVFSDEPTGLPVIAPPPAITFEVRQTVEALKRSAVCPISNISQTALQISSQPAVEALTERLGIGTRAAEARLTAAVNAGKLGRVRRGLYALPIVVKAPMLPAVIIEARPAPVTIVVSTIDINFDSLDRQIDSVFDAFDRQIDEMRSMLASLLRPPNAVKIDPEFLVWHGVGGSDLSEIVPSRPHVTATNADTLKSVNGHAWLNVGQ